MKEILIFAGTTEGRALSERLSDAGIRHTVCVATEYGKIVLKEHPLVTVHQGRMDQKEIRAFLTAGGFAAVVDATHPYAEEVTENIKGAMQGLAMPYLRLKRECGAESNDRGIVYFKNDEACAKALETVKGNILLTTGSKKLSLYCSADGLRERLYVRVLPGVESIRLCMAQGISGKRILALQGPFSAQLNEAMLRQYQIQCLVTKQSGRAGGYREKLEAAETVGIPVFVVGSPKEDDGSSFADVCHALERICGQKIRQNAGFEMILAGVGMGDRQCLTREVYHAVCEADILLGAERLIAEYRPKIEKRPYYRAEQIIPYLKELQLNGQAECCRKVVILFSGDSGLYSGCQALYHALKKEIETSGLEGDLSILPGISSVAYLSARMGESYDDAAICSMHGRELPNLAGRIRRERKLFLLVSGLEDMHRLGAVLVKGGLEHCTVTAGYRLSYPEQKIMELTPKECLQLKQEGLYVCCIKNPMAKRRELTHGMGDAEFLRDRVPMTKEEVREVSICKLKLHEEAVVYDIGSGTGSMAVEMAGLSDRIRVFAVEKKAEAAALIRANKEKFELDNIEIIQADAPECLRGLPAPTHAFIGGSGGKMKAILETLYRLNPRMRVVIHAVSLETLCEIRDVLAVVSIQDQEIVQLQVSRGKSAGAYHLMQAENPVWICAFDFQE